MLLDQLPALDGTLHADDASRRQFSVDLALNIQRIPLAVLKPGSVEDIVKMVRYANQHNLKIAMRGQGHSRYGQTLVEAGIVIDSRTLRAVVRVGDEGVDAQAGAFWGEVAQLSLAKGLTPPAMGTCMSLSVGGFLSSGGHSNSSHLFGAVADTVQELDVVTGDGRLITCSAGQEGELFDMVLAGMGQCALIVRARLQLVRAPTRVVRQDLFYDDLEAFISDAKRVVLDDRFDHLFSRAFRNSDGGWSFSINVGKFYYGAGEWAADSEFAALQDGLRFHSTSKLVRTSYWEYLERDAAKNAADKAAREQNPQREPSVVVFVPAGAIKNFVAQLIAAPLDLAGLADFQLNPFNVRRFRCPLFKFPDEDITFGVWLYPRNVPINNAAAYAAAMDVNRGILEKMRACGGKVYPPYAPYFSQPEWQEHFGPATWQRLLAAKRKYDPKNVLTPGLGMFGGIAGLTH